MSGLAIIVGTVYGNSQHVAETVEQYVSGEGFEVSVHDNASVQDFVDADAILVITSTTGQGDVPPNLELTFDELRDQFPLLTNKPFAVAALGDSSYGETFCGAGHKFHELLLELQGKAVADLLEVDAIETLEPEEDVLTWVKGLLPTLIEV